MTMMCINRFITFRKERISRTIICTRKSFIKKWWLLLSFIQCPEKSIIVTSNLLFFYDYYFYYDFICCIFNFLKRVTQQNLISCKYIYVIIAQKKDLNNFFFASRHLISKRIKIKIAKKKLNELNWGTQYKWFLMKIFVIMMSMLKFLIFGVDSNFEYN